MRLKLNVDFRQSVLIVYRRVTLSKLTLFYFLFSLIHAVIQVLFQGQAYQINTSAANFIHTIVIAANSTVFGFPVLEGDTLSVCTSIDPLKCTLVWSLLDGNQTYTKGIETDPEQLTFSNPSPTFPSTTTVSASNQPLVIGTSVFRPLSTVRPSLPTLTPIQASNTVEGEDDGEEEVEENHSASKRSLHLKTPISFPLTRRGGVGSSTTMLVSPASDSSKTGAAIKIQLQNLPDAPPEVTLDQQCLVALNWPLEVLHNTQREDITFIFFHIWVLGMSMTALLNESVVHMLASLLTHIIVTAWSAFQLGHTKAFQSNFQKIITQGSCDNQNLLPTYWKDRAAAEIPAAVFNAVALVISAFLTYKLIKTFSWATFKRIGASRQISRVYKFVLSLSVLLQLGLFFIVVSMALWIDQICSGLIAMLVVHMTLYKGIYITVMILLIPWIVVGWKAVRLENRRLMHGFLVFNVLMIGGWAGMFSSITFRYVFTQWAFFRLMWLAAVILIICILVLGVICRRNFGLDLKRFLSTQSKIEDEEDFVSAYSPQIYSGDISRKGSIASTVDSLGSVSYGDEKIDFPSTNERAVPTFGAMFPAVSRNASNASTNSPLTPITPPKTVQLPSRFSDTGSSVPPSYGPKEVDVNRISISSAHSVSSISFGPIGSRPDTASTLPMQPPPSQKYSGRSKKWLIE